MKKIFEPILLPIFVDSCAAGTDGVLPSGSKSECLEAVTTKLFVAKTAFRFVNIASFKDMADWNTAIQSKDIVPLYNVYEVASENTEATKYETGNFSYVTKKETKRMVSESYLSICSHAVLKSIENSEYTQVFEVTEAGEILGVFDSDGIKIKGQDITNFDVAIRERSTNDKPGFSKVTITFRDFEEFENNGIIAKPEWDANTLNGIFAIQLQLDGAATATGFDVKAFSGCGSMPYEDYADGDFVFVDSVGTPQTITVTVVDNVYTIAGTALTSGTLTAPAKEVNGEWVEAIPLDITI